MVQLKKNQLYIIYYMYYTVCVYTLCTLLAVYAEVHVVPYVHACSVFIYSVYVFCLHELVDAV